MSASGLRSARLAALTAAWLRFSRLLGVGLGGSLAGARLEEDFGRRGLGGLGFVLIRAALAARGLTSVLNYLKDVAVGTEEGRLIVVFAVGVGG